MNYLIVKKNEMNEFYYKSFTVKGKIVGYNSIENAVHICHKLNMKSLYNHLGKAKSDLLKFAIYNTATGQII